eukprot:m.465059 g.465059  ORF g.465059 m.465059 type:complete len:63 (+) comp23952_c0_seq1:1134-1322(+)
MLQFEQRIQSDSAFHRRSDLKLSASHMGTISSLLLPRDAKGGRRRTSVHLTRLRVQQSSASV